MGPTITPAPNGFEVREIPPDDYVKHPVYRVTFMPASTDPTPTTPTAPISKDYVHVGVICVFPWEPGFYTTIFAPKADARYSWQTDDIDMGSFDTMDQAIETIAALTPPLWVHWLNNTDHVW